MMEAVSFCEMSVSIHQTFSYHFLGITVGSNVKCTWFVLHGKSMLSLVKITNDSWKILFKIKVNIFAFFVIFPFVLTGCVQILFVSHSYSKKTSYYKAFRWRLGNACKCERYLKWNLECVHLKCNKDITVYSYNCCWYRYEVYVFY
jgi:hypothetical protein